MEYLYRLIGRSPFMLQALSDNAYMFVQYSMLIDNTIFRLFDIWHKGKSGLSKT